MKTTALHIFLALFGLLLLLGCEPSPQEATELFCQELSKGNFKACEKWLSPALRQELLLRAKDWKTLAFATGYYMQTNSCKFLRYVTEEGRAHTYFAYDWRWQRIPVPGHVVIDLVWGHSNNCWRIEKAMTASNWIMLKPLTADSPKEAFPLAKATSCGLRYPLSYEALENALDFGDRVEEYLRTWY